MSGKMSVFGVARFVLGELRNLDARLSDLGEDHPDPAGLMLKINSLMDTAENQATHIIHTPLNMLGVLERRNEDLASKALANLRRVQPMVSSYADAAAQMALFG